ncbi:hypothetical protein DPEC_G00029190 [Dallia pectoralis]|uniref:Uncharacterized protein n=1 Tax=Dallia pectoralis TaxID=75939 RepID=A0ACC2HJA9_DALPE|nr:hypothetical protein DPEC_G00029190 [Dallia pectoralis]
MQVDPNPVNVGDGGMVSKEIGTVSMVGNPPQTLELRRDVPLIQQNRITMVADCKTPVNVCSDSSNFNHCPVAPPPQQLNHTPTSGPPLIGSDKRSEVAKPKLHGAEIFLAHQWPCGTKVSPDDPANPSHSSVPFGQKPHTQTQSLISLPAGFQCSTLFKPGQPVSFLPTANLSSPLCKITLPPALGQIAALREATASQFQKESQTQSAGATPLLRTYPYHFAMGRCPSAEKKTLPSKVRCNSTFRGKSSQREQKSTVASGVVSPTIAIPVQHPPLGSPSPTHFTLSPPATLCCGSALAGITTQSRLLNHGEKGPPRQSIADKTSVGFLKVLPGAEDRAVVPPAEARDVPLDLSAKSMRLKTTMRGPPNVVGVAEQRDNETRPKVSLHPKRPHVGTYSSAPPYPILPNTHRNGTHPKATSRPQNHQGLDPNPSWVRGSSQGSMNNLPGTYVGVASPILASTLRSKDGKGSFEDEFQTFARQETISIIDQGEQLASRGKKVSFMMKGNQHVHGIKHPTSTSPAVTQSCPSKGAFTTALPTSANSYSHQKLGTIKAKTQYPPAAVKPLWQQPALLPHQGASVQRKVGQGAFKVKEVPSSEDLKSQIACQNPSRMEEEKWDRTKSPLSNLESIVKQKALETTALTGEGYGHLATVARRPDGLNFHPVCQDTLFHQTAAFGCPPYRYVEKRERPSSHGDSTLVMDKLNKLCVSEPNEKSTEKRIKPGELVDGKDGQVYAERASHTQAFGSVGSGTRNGADSKLAQELEGGVMKEESTTAFGLTPCVKLEQVGISIPTDQSALWVTKVEKTNRTEVEPPKATSVVAKQKKPPSPRKSAKERAPVELSKKTVVSGKKKTDQEIPPVKKYTKNKKPHTPKTTPNNEERKSVSVTESSSHDEERKSVSVTESTSQDELRKSVSVTESTPHSQERKSVSVTESTPHSQERKSVSVTESTPHSQERKSVSVTESTPHSQERKSACGEKTIQPVTKAVHYKPGSSSAVLSSSLSSATPDIIRCPGRTRKEAASSDGSTPRLSKELASSDGSTPRLSKELAFLDASTPRLSKEAASSDGSTPRLSKELAFLDNSTPRLRRCRRRGDEARLDNWGFATPSPPRLPSPPHPASPHSEPARRPRGRPRTHPLPEKCDQFKTRTTPCNEGDNPTRRKRTRCRNKKYQNGEYIIEKAKDEDGEEGLVRHRTISGSDLKTGMYPRLSATLTCRGSSPEPGPRRPLFGRSVSARQSEKETSLDPGDKPSGKRKFKSKHLGLTGELKKVGSKRLGKHPASSTTDDDSPDAKKQAGLSATAKSFSSPPASKKGTPGRGGTSESPRGRPVPPEVRRLIVNKNAGETLLQRAARLGYQVRWCFTVWRRTSGR